jgi:hypothetical protein
MAGNLEMGEHELRKRLLEFDRAVALLHPGRSFRLVLVGGGALVLLGCLARATDDLDALRFPAELLPLMEKFDLSARVLAFEDQFAYHVDDRLVPLDLGTKAVEYYSASLEDIVASKLYSNRPKDADDVRRPEVLERLDWDRLAEVVEDMARSKLVERRHRELLHSYRLYREECEPCDA